MAKKNYYQILQVDPAAEPEVIQAVYKQLTLKYHSDTNKAADAIQRLSEIDEAYAVISDPVSRIAYDRQIETATVTSEQLNERVEVARATSKNNQNSWTLTLVKGVAIEFVRIPEGDFLMGMIYDRSTQRIDFNEIPQREIYVDAFHMCKYPITVAQFAIFVSATNYQYRHKSHLDTKNKANHPVTFVSWDDAVAFCEWASNVTRMSVRLPTEAEWEKAARGPDGRMYPWGNIPPHGRCNFQGNDHSSTSPVDAHSPRGDSPYGCADMVGNVGEWVADWFDEDYYKKSPYINPKGPAQGVCRVKRGNNFYGDRFDIYVTSRSPEDPTVGLDTLGFRCACN